MIDKILDEAFGRLRPYITIYRVLGVFFFLSITSPVFYAKVIDGSILGMLFLDGLDFFKRILYESNFWKVVFMLILCLGGGGFVARFLIMVGLWLNCRNGYVEEEVRRVYSENESNRREMGEVAFREKLEADILRYKKKVVRIRFWLEMLVVCAGGMVVNLFVIKISTFYVSVYLFLTALFLLVFYEVASSILRGYAKTEAYRKWLIDLESKTASVV